MSSKRKEMQRLYRYIQQLAYCLDAQLQNITDWTELFDIETVLTRQKLKDACEKFLIQGYCDSSRKVEDILWRKGFYDLIQKLRQDKQMLQTNGSLQALYNAHLDAAHCFYHHLLIDIKEKFCAAVKSPTDILCVVPSGAGAAKDAAKKECFEWGMKSCQRCLLYLGDLARYRIDMNDWNAGKIAERFYYEAVLINPDNGMPHNQLGTLKQQIGDNDCEVAYHYLRCLFAVNSFEGAEANFKRTLDRNRSSQKDCKQNDEVQGDEKILQSFLREFLDLQRYFLNESRQSDVNKCCYKPVIDKFVRILNISTLENITQANDSKDIKRNEEIIPSLSTQKSVRISSTLMIKIFTICILIISKLSQNGSDALAVSISFTCTLLVELLNSIINAMYNSPLAKILSGLQKISEPETKKVTGETVKKDVECLHYDDYDADYAVERAGQIRKYRHLRRRRRRRRKHLCSEDSSDVDDAIDDYTEHSRHESTDDSGSDLSEGNLQSEENGHDEFYSSSESNSEYSSFENPFYLKEQTQSPEGKTINLNEAGRLLSLQCQEQLNARKFQRVFNESIVSNMSKELSLQSQLEAVLSYLNEYCYLSTLKIVADWIRNFHDLIGNYAEDIDLIHRKYADVIQNIPGSSVLNIVLQCGKKRMDSRLVEFLNDTSRRQCKALPEDASLFGMPIFHQFHKTLDFIWAEKIKDPLLLQFLVRLHSLKAFIVSLETKSQAVEEPGISHDMDNGGLSSNNSNKSIKPDCTIKENICQKDEKQETSTKSNDCELTNQAEKKDKKDLMKALAKQKLTHDVMQLRDKMSSSDLNESSNMPSYLILDCQALCRHLSLIRSLVKSREFLFIIPVQVVQALDELKRYNPSAREAIKFLEDELRQKSRWLRSQKDQEFLDVNIKPDGKKKKKLAIEEWRFFQLVKCACYFASLHNMKNIVFILTTQTTGDSLGSLGTRATLEAIEFCKKMGIKTEAVVDFYQKWVEKKTVDK